MGRIVAEERVCANGARGRRAPPTAGVGAQPMASRAASCEAGRGNGHDAESHPMRGHTTEPVRRGSRWGRARAGAVALALTGFGAPGCGPPQEAPTKAPTRADAAPVEGRLYDFPVGTKWEVDAAFNGDKRTCVFTVASREGTRTAVEYDIFNPPDPGATASMDEVWYLEDGYVLWGSRDDDKTSAWWRVYKLGSKEGDTWDGPAGKGRATHRGFGEVTVPAGSYTDVLHVRLSDEDGKTHDFHYAPQVGLVRWATTGPSGTALLSLRTFTPGPLPVGGAHR